MWRESMVLADQRVCKNGPGRHGFTRGTVGRRSEQGRIQTHANRESRDVKLKLFLPTLVSGCVELHRLTQPDVKHPPTENIKHTRAHTKPGVFGMEYFDFQENGRSGDRCQHFLVKATSTPAAYTRMSEK